MKKFLIAAIAASVIVTPAIAAPGYGHQGNQRTVVKKVDRGPHRTVVTKKVVQKNRYQPQRVEYRKWSKGQKFDRRYAQNYRQIDYRQYRQQRLYSPPRGYQWVQSGNDAVLIGITSGIIGAVIGGVLR